MTRPSPLALSLALALVVAVAVALGAAPLPQAFAQAPAAGAPAAPSKVSGKPAVTASGLKIYELKKGTGAVAKAGDQVKVHYTGWLTSGKKFDSSLDRGEPIAFKLGAGMVIKGWDEGVAGMKVGQKRQLQIPAGLAYGERGAGGVIPPNAELVFDVELVAVN